MKAGIYDPYLDTIGGGERYCLTFAEMLIEKGWEVDLFWSTDEKIRSLLINKFNLNINNIKFFNYNPKDNNILKKRKIEQNYDLLFYFSDGSVPFMFGKKNILHFQVPFLIKGINIKNKSKFKLIDFIICNSNFTKSIIDKSFGVKSTTIYPPVDIDSIKPLEKENIILSLGRFSQLLQSKKQDVLVKAFKKMVDGGLKKEWRLILAGGSEIGGTEFVKQLKKQANGYKIQIIENPSFKEVIDLYGEAKLFWSASGYGVDEIANPEKVEHFGITTVESMVAGCVPIVMDKGGQKEIVVNNVSGFLWKEEEELIEISNKLIEDSLLLEKISKNAILKSKEYSQEIFKKDFNNLLNI